MYEGDAPHVQGSVMLRTVIRPANSMTAQIIEAATAYLLQKGTRAQTTEITEAVVRDGASLPDNPTKQRDYVSSILSHSPLFNNVRGEGYGLAEWPVERQAATAGDEADPPEGQPKLLRPNGEMHVSY